MIKVLKSNKEPNEKAEVLLHNLSKLKHEIATIEARYNMKSDYTEICEDAILKLSAMKAERQNNILSENITTGEKANVQSIVDRVADSIEVGLDKIGDGILFPFDKAISLFDSIFQGKHRK